MTITASYNPLAFDLTVTGDTAGNSIVISRNAGGTLLVNGGAVPVSGGPATVANTDLIAVSGDLGNDTITLDETNGALPSAELVGGGGNDALTGGSSSDSLFGEAGNDTLLGRGGTDLLDGGDDNDTLAGGDGDDQMLGGLGDDRLIWNPGDDTDLWEGGGGSDTGEVNGGNGAEVFTITANGTRVRFDRIDPAPFLLDIGTTENLVLNASGGNDTISTSGNLAALISLTLDGGAGNDTILGSNGIDTLLGGDGNDFIDGQQGNDVAFLGANDDVFQWDPGDGSDTVEGQAGMDTLLFNGSAANEIYELSANGARALLTRNVGAIVMDVNDLETFTINALGGTDSVVLNDLSGTDATQINVDLSGTLGGTAGDGQADVVTVNASNGANAVTLTGAGTAFGVTGLTASVAVTNSEGANDAFTLNGLGGNDSLTATSLPAGIVRLTLDGGAGDDTILASQGADTLLGGDGNDFVFGDNGNDTAFLGVGDDVFQWQPGDGNDIVEGQGGTDGLLFDGSNASETVNIAANGGRLLFIRDVAAVTLDLDDVERIRFNAIGGTDSIVIGDLSGTDAQQIDVDLALSGAGDGAADTVTVNATNAADVYAVSSSGGVVTVGLPWGVSLFGAEGANDRLALNAAGGDDVINASTLAVGLVSLTVNGGLGADLFIGSGGHDLFSGGDGNDTALLGAGNDIAVWNPGDDNDTIEGQSGTDTLQFNGAGVAENITISPNGGRALFFRDVANVTMDINDTEVIQFAALGGADNIVVNDIGGTDVTKLVIGLAGVLGGASGDAAVDSLTLNATGAANSIKLAGTGTALAVTGLPWSAEITWIETSDHLRINAGDGNDRILTAGIANLLTVLTLDGGAGNDIIRSTGDGTYLGGTGDDLILAGLTNSSEVMDGGDGIDTLDTRTWGGLYTINLVTGVTNYSGESYTNFENLISGDGDDTITGTAAANVIRTTGGADSVAAGDGNDTVEGGALGDALDGGAGVDTLVYESSDAGVTVSLASGAASGGHATGDSVTGFENLTGSIFADTLAGNGSDNVIAGLAGNDTIAGLAGADDMNGGAGIDTLDYSASAAGVTVSLTTGAASGGDATGDVFTSFERAIGSAFADTLRGNGLANMLTGNDGDDVLRGEGGNDQINGGIGADLLYGGNGDDIIQGASGNDRLIGNGGTDTLRGGTGDDEYYVASLDDTVIENAGEGTDLIRSTIDLVLANNVENLAIGGAGRDGTGNALANTLHGSASSNVLSGLGGNDILRGDGGRDTLLGGNGEDLIDGGVGKDTLSGGGARDVFQFRDGDFGATRALADVITDFSHAAAEKIQLNLVDANTAAGGNQAFAWIGNGAFTGVAGQLHYAHAAGNTYVEGDTDGDGVADFVIALTGTVNLVASDFVL
jgi:Ca2+-binding RTX toxin-like protein